MPYNYQFDATQFQPQQGGGGHPAGQFPAFVSNTEIRPTKEGDGGMFVVEFTTPQGKIENRYNLWNKNQKAVEIAHRELSALSHATGVFKLDMNNDGAALRNAKCQIIVGKQEGSEYMEIKKVLDGNGIEPGKPAQQPQQQPGSQAPGGWGTQQQQPLTPQAQQTDKPGGGWGTQQQPQPGNNTQPGWGQTQSAANPPWGQR